MDLARPLLNDRSILNDTFRVIGVSAAGIIFWVLASAVLKTGEPWDSPHYLAWYLGSLGLAAVFGWTFNNSAWRWGTLIIFAQLPVILAQASIGPLLALGIALLAIQAIPAALASMTAAKARKAFRRPHV